MKRWTIGVAALVVLIAPTARADTPDIVAYKFYGPNTQASAEPGDIGGGYYTLDPSLLSPEGVWTRTGMDIRHDYYYYKTQWDMFGFAGAIDNSLSDNSPMRRLSSSYAMGVNTTVKVPANEWPPPNLGDSGAGYIRYDTFMNVGFANGPPVSPGQTLGSYVESHGIASIAGEGSRYAYIEAPTVETFTARDIFDNKESIWTQAVGQAIHAGFEPHLNIGGFDVPVPLSLVEDLSGFDHFNWVQWVTFDNDPDRPIARASGLQVEAMYLDPPLGGYKYQPYGDDFLVGYWNEDSGELEEYTKEYYLEFLDAPGVTEGSLVQFKTALAGIDDSGLETLVSPWFYWESTSLGANVRKNTDLSVVTNPDLTLLGIFPLEDLSPEDILFLESQGIGIIPEPSTLALLTMGTLALLAYAWRRRRT